MHHFNKLMKPAVTQDLLFCFVFNAVQQMRSRNKESADSFATIYEVLAVHPPS